MRDLNPPHPDQGMLTAHNRAVAQPRPAAPRPPARYAVHPMCLAMSEVYQHEPAAAPIEAPAAEAVNAAPVVTSPAAPSGCMQPDVYFMPEFGPSWPAYWGIDGRKFAADAQGWIAYDPRPDAVCPVPAGLDFRVRFADGSASSLPVGDLRDDANAWRVSDGPSRINAWRPAWPLPAGASE
jgi:hypothetical protein